MAMPMIAELIYNGATAETLNISEGSYMSRKETLDRFMATGPKLDDFEQEYTEWLVIDNKSRGLGDTVAKITSAIGIRPCGGCKKRQESLNKLIPYSQDGNL